MDYSCKCPVLLTATKSVFTTTPRGVSVNNIISQNHRKASLKSINGIKSTAI